MTRPAALIAAALIITSGPALAEVDLAARMAGTYGSDMNPDFSCEQNPVTLSFTAAPQHAIFSWDVPTGTVVGPARTREVYDLIGPVEGGLLMRLEGEPRRTDSGNRPVWILRPTQDYGGFCWGRADWSVLRCVSHHHRCAADVPSS